jgi:hypothetical protein
MMSFLLTLLMLGETADIQYTDEPFVIAAPRTVVERWTQFGGFPASTTESIPIKCSEVRGVRQEAGRADILRRDGKRWMWLATLNYGPELTIPKADFDRGILVRFDRSSTYFWSEVPAHTSTPVDVKPFRNVAIDAPPGATLTLYVPSEERPRTLVDGPFRLVPAATILACATSANESRCTEVGAASGRVALSFDHGDDARIVRVVPQADDTFSIIAKGNVVIRPKSVGRAIAHVPPWVAVGLQKGVAWNNVLIDRAGRELAIERLMGSSLAPPPAFTDVPSRRERGLVIRPSVGSQRMPLSDPAALLLVFLSQDETLASEIPLVTSQRERDGSFHLPTLASGTYVLKLLSSLTTMEPVTVSAMAGTPLDVVFRSGPTVTGRIVRAAGGAPTDPGTIEISGDENIQQAVKSGDLMDRMRVATPDENGTFRVVVAIAGHYRLRARWGAATAERTFEIGASTKDLDLGDIALKSGAALLGDVPGCRAGQATAIAVPDVSKPPNFDTVNAPIGVDGRFLMQGLSPGQWSILLQCDGKPVMTEPRVVTISESGDAVVRFVQRQP